MPTTPSTHSHLFPEFAPAHGLPAKPKARTKALHSSRAWTLIALPLLLCACAGTPVAGSTAGASATPAGRCNAAPAQFAMGQPASAALTDNARQRAGARTARVLRPDQVVTMEFNAERLNLAVDANGRITRVSCG